VLVAAPIGVATAVYLTEYTREGRLTAVIRFGRDCLAGVPSIIFGLFGFRLLRDYSGDGAFGSFRLAHPSRSWCCRPSYARAKRPFAPCPTPTGRSASVSAAPAGRWSSPWSYAPPFLGFPRVSSVARRRHQRNRGCDADRGLRTPFAALLFDSSRTLALHFYILSREGISMPNAYATASVLIIAILALNLLAYWLMRRFVAKVGR